MLDIDGFKGGEGYLSPADWKHDVDAAWNRLFPLFGRLEFKFLDDTQSFVVEVLVKAASDLCFRDSPLLVDDASDDDLALNIGLLRIAFELLLEEAIETRISPFILGWFDRFLRSLATFRPRVAKIEDLGFGWQTAEKTHCPDEHRNESADCEKKCCQLFHFSMVLTAKIKNICLLEK